MEGALHCEVDCQGCSYGRCLYGCCSHGCSSL
jgi:hypothetical protein